MATRVAAWPRSTAAKFRAWQRTLTGAERPLGLADELLEVVLDDAVERHQVAIEIVEHFDQRRLQPHDEESPTPSAKALT